MVTPHSVFANQLTAASADDTARQQRAADALRRIARDEKLKALAETDPLLAPLLQRAADRYTGGSTLEACLGTIEGVNAQGHAATADYMGESTREAAVANAETEHFLKMVKAITARRLNCSVSLDLSHIGLAIDHALALDNAARIATATRDAGLEMMISMEGSERTDAVLQVHGQLCSRFEHVGVTVQARMKRTPADMALLLKRPGRIRLVKGAYDEPETTAHQRISDGATQAYRALTQTLLSSGHRCSIGTHDRQQLNWAHEFIQGHAFDPKSFEFEVLYGLGPAQSDHMRALGHATRQYIVYGSEWFLYVCHRIAEHPPRLFDALADIVGAPESSSL
jgi:proline dehydrogenase